MISSVTVGAKSFALSPSSVTVAIVRVAVVVVVVVVPAAVVVTISSDIFSPWLASFCASSSSIFSSFIGSSVVVNVRFASISSTFGGNTSAGAVLVSTTAALVSREPFLRGTFFSIPHAFESAPIARTRIDSEPVHKCSMISASVASRMKGLSDCSGCLKKYLILSSVTTIFCNRVATTPWVSAFAPSRLYFTPFCMGRLHSASGSNFSSNCTYRKIKDAHFTSQSAALSPERVFNAESRMP